MAVKHLNAFSIFSSFLTSQSCHWSLCNINPRKPNPICGYKTSMLQSMALKFSFSFWTHLHWWCRDDSHSAINNFPPQQKSPRRSAQGGEWWNHCQCNLGGIRLPPEHTRGSLVGVNPHHKGLKQSKSLLVKRRKVEIELYVLWICGWGRGSLFHWFS